MDRNRAEQTGWKRAETAGPRLLRAAAITAFLLLPAGAGAQDTGEHLPAATAPGETGFVDGENGLICDDVVAQAVGNGHSQDYYGYGFTLPDGASVVGIAVRVRANNGTRTNRRFTVSLSWDGGASFTEAENTPNFRRGAPLADYELGGSAYLWGRTWAASELADTSFRVRATGERGTVDDPANLDCIPVTVYFAAPTGTATLAPSTPTATATDTATPVPTETATPVPTDTATMVPTATDTPTAVPAPTDTPTPELSSDCAATPVAGCRGMTLPQKSLLLLKDRGTDDGHMLVWRWSRGQATLVNDFGDPVNGATGYRLCIYDAETPGEFALSTSTAVNAGGDCSGRPCWKALGSADPRGYLFRDRERTQDGVLNVLLKAGDDGKAKVLIKAKGPGVPVPSLPLAQNRRVAAQLIRTDANVCWEAIYSTPALRADSSLFKEKSD